MKSLLSSFLSSQASVIAVSTVAAVGFIGTTTVVYNTVFNNTAAANVEDIRQEGAPSTTDTESEDATDGNDSESDSNNSDQVETV